MEKTKNLTGALLQGRLLFLAMEMTNNLTLSEMLMNNKRWCELQGVKKEGGVWKQLAIQGVSCSASDVISKIKHLPESDFSEDGQLKLLRACGNALGLYKSVKWMQKHSCTEFANECNKENHLQKLTDQAQDLGLGYD
tara:strand:+ start:305 stop:718 length:414 start_codon:yes stop_codon:yes gene_type:complete